MEIVKNLVMGIGTSFNIDSIPLEDRHGVLGGDCTLESIAAFIKEGRAKNIVVVMGAGASVSAGIPDFRTPGTGLYDNLGKYDLPTPESIFDLGFFKKNPAPFYTLAREIFPGTGEYSPTPTHRFLVLLQEKGLLRRVYTQNIDGLERLAGLDDDKVVQAHGGFNSGHCIRCNHEVDAEWLKTEIFEERTPVMCPKCSEIPDVPSESRSEPQPQPGEDDSDQEEEPNPSFIKPRITFFGENLPPRFFECKKQDLKTEEDGRTDEEQKEHVEVQRALNKLNMQSRLGLDSEENQIEVTRLSKKAESFAEEKEKKMKVSCLCDLMLVFGTSLKVQPVASLPDELTPLVPRVLFNREPVHVEPPHNEYKRGGESGFRFNLEDNYRDVFVQGDTDDGVRKLASLLDWKLD